MRIVLGVAGGIAAYKAVLLLRLLKEAGHDVRAIPTAAALKFVGAPTWEALAGHPVTADVFYGTDTVDHVRFGQEADLIIVAPATADLLARAATGQADDLLTASLLVATAPVLMAPAMHTEMWQHPATVANVAILRSRGIHVLDPDSGRLTGADTGPGRLPEPERIAAAALALVGLGPKTPGRLAGRHLVVSAGGTQEALDPVRFLGNRSTGHQGVAVALAAAAADASVDLIACNIGGDVLPDHPGITITPAISTADLQSEMLARADADVLVMVAAVADFRPKTITDTKIKKDETDPDSAPVIELVRNPDILRGLVHARRPGQIIVGFAAETGDADTSVLEHGRAKARRKGADLLAVNEVSTTTGFGDVPNRVTVLDADGDVLAEITGSKTEVGEGLVSVIADLLGSADPLG